MQRIVFPAPEGEQIGAGRTPAGTSLVLQLWHLPWVDLSALLPLGVLVSILAGLRGLSGPRKVACRQPGQQGLFRTQQHAAPLRSGGREALVDEAP